MAIPPLVSTEWLDAHIDDPDLVMLDASIFIQAKPDQPRSGDFLSGIDAFEHEGHIPGSRFADLFIEFSDPDAQFPFTRPKREAFKAAAGRLGIRANSHIVIYDRLVGQWAARLWWVFRSFGHEAVSVLDGGLRKYVAEGRTLRTGPPLAYSTSRYAAGEARHIASRDDVAAIMDGRRTGHLVCMLQEPEFAGQVSARKRPGHIPGSVNLPFSRLIDERTNSLQPPEIIRNLFSSVTPLDGTEIVTYCGAGIASTLGALALAVIGYENWLEYDGALMEWSSDPDLPLELGR